MSSWAVRLKLKLFFSTFYDHCLVFSINFIEIQNWNRNKSLQFLNCKYFLCNSSHEMYMSSDWSKEQMTVLWLADRVKDHQTVPRLRNEGKFLNNSANFMTTIYPSATASWKQGYDKSREIKYFSRKQAIKRSNFEIFVNQ